MPNQRVIAKHLGLAQTTVSRALRNSPLVTAETRALVLKAAMEQGYRPHPYVTALMANIHSGRLPPDQGCLALVSDVGWKERVKSHEVFRIWWEHLNQRAHLRGYRVEVFLTKAPGMSGEKVNRILTARGIRGVIIGNCSERFFEESRQAFDWDRYSCATPMEIYNSYGIDCVCTDSYHNMMLAFQRVMEKGYKRIGLVLPKTALSPHHIKEWLGSYLACQLWVPPGQRLAPLLGSPKDTTLDEFAAWRNRWKPDALLCLWGEEMQWVDALGLSFKQLAVACVNRSRGSIFSGVDENNGKVGETLCDVVVNQLTHNEHGFPKHRQTVHIKGDWIEGETLPGKT